MERRVHDQRGHEHRGGDHGIHAAQADARAPALVRIDCAMRIAIVGAGAIGGYLGGWLAAAGEDVTFIARGANLEAICTRGMKVTGEDGNETIATNVRAFSRMSDAGAHDVVLLTVKAHQVAAVASDLHHLCHDETAIVTMQNGIPWWYFRNAEGPFAGHTVEAADPGG